MLRQSHRRWGAAVLMLFFVAASLMIAMPMLHMHSDEDLSYRATRGTLADTIYYQQSMQDNQAPLWFVSLWAWRQLVGDAEWTSRTLGVLMVLPALAFAYRIGWAWFGARAALFGLAAIACNAYFVTYAMDIRPYPLVMLAATFSVWAFDRWLRRPKWRMAIVYGLSLALLMYVHYLLAFLIVAQGLILLASRRLNRRLLVQGVGAALLGVALWLPWFPTFVTQVVGLRNVEQASGMARGVAGIGVSTLLTSPRTIGELINLMTNSLILLYALVLIYAAARLWRRERFWLAMVWAFVVPAVYLGVNLLAGVYAHRFVSYTTIPLALIAGAAGAALPRRLQLPLVAAFLLVNLWAFPSQMPTRTPYRDVLRQVPVEPGDMLYLDHAGEHDQSYTGFQLRYYLKPGYEVIWDHDIEAAEAARRVWFITADWFNDDVRATFDRLEPTHPVRQVIGGCDVEWCYLAQLMEAPPRETPQQFGRQMLFWGADIDTISRERIDARLWWRVEETPELDYSIGLHLLDANGGLVAQSDGAIQHYGVETVQTSQMEAGRIYIDHRALILPPDLPPGEYTLTLVVYQSWDNARLEINGGDELVIDIVRIL